MESVDFFSENISLVNFVLWANGVITRKVYFVSDG